MHKLILRSVCPQLAQNLTKTWKNLAKFSTQNSYFCFQTNFDDFIFGRKHPNVSECVKAGPNKPENVETHGENMEKVRETLVVIEFRATFSGTQLRCIAALF